MLVTTAVINSEFWQVKSKIEATPDMTRDMIADELRRAAGRINLVIARNIKRNAAARKIYDTLLADGAEPIVLDLKEVR